MTTSKRVMIVVTHLLGSGHLSRALTLANTFAAHGDETHLVSGGRPAPHLATGSVTLHQLPSVHVEGTAFTTLYTPSGAVADAAYLAHRSRSLTALLTQIAPDILITELFPFGRRILSEEYDRLLNTAHQQTHRPLILSSVRDILAPPSKPRKIDFAKKRIMDQYDGVICHSDPDIITLDESWPIREGVAEKLHYSGFVAAAPPEQVSERSSDIIVSTGGGSVGDTIFETAIEAARAWKDRHWYFMVAGSDERRAALANGAPRNVTIMSPQPDYRARLARAAASVSVCGYNTALDLLQTGTPSLIIPFDDGGEVEQTLRAKKLSQLSGIAHLSQAELTAETMLEALARVMKDPMRAPRLSGMDGATETVRLAHQLHGAFHGILQGAVRGTRSGAAR